MPWDKTSVCVVTAAKYQKSFNEMSEKEIVVSVRNLGKSYRVWKDPSARLKAPLVQALKKYIPFRKEDEQEQVADPHARISNRNRYFYDFKALKGVSLDLQAGESIGIIGRNGSGKSTLLQMIAGTLTPTEGEVHTKGRIAALLELGAGFNDEFTGRENVYMNGTILGLTKAEIDERFERITEFANIGEFIDQPIKTYSSGMRVRLAFAVQAEVDPDILIVDEALAVGDIRFTMKCIRRMKELVENGTTLIFVSHDLGSIVSFCKEVIWIHDGQVFRRGNPKEVTLEYSNFMHYGELTKTNDGSSSALNADFIEDSEVQASLEKNASDVFDLDGLPSELRWVDLSDLPRDGAGGVLMQKAALYSPDHPSNNMVFHGGENIEIYLLFRANKDLDSPILCSDIYNSKGTLIYGVNTCFTGDRVGKLKKGSSYLVRFKTVLKHLRNGNYVILLGMSNGTYEEHIHEFGVAEAISFEVNSQSLSQRHHVISFDEGKVELLGEK